VDLLEVTARELPERAWLHSADIPVPILYIDQAKLLCDLVANNVEGQKLLKNKKTLILL